MATTFQLESKPNYRYLAYGGGDHGETRRKTIKIIMMRRYQNKYLEDMEATTMAKVDDLQPVQMMAAQTARAYTSQLSILVKKTEHRRCADHFMLHREQLALKNHKEWYDEAQANL